MIIIRQNSRPILHLWSRRHQLPHVDRAHEEPRVDEELVRGDRRRGLRRVEPVPEHVAAAVPAQGSRVVAPALAEDPSAAARPPELREVCPEKWGKKSIRNF